MKNILATYLRNWTIQIKSNLGWKKSWVQKNDQSFVTAKTLIAHNYQVRPFVLNIQFLVNLCNAILKKYYQVIFKLACFCIVFCIESAFQNKKVKFYNHNVAFNQESEIYICCDDIADDSHPQLGKKCEFKLCLSLTIHFQDIQNKF